MRHDRRPRQPAVTSAKEVSAGVRGGTCLWLATVTVAVAVAVWAAPDQLCQPASGGQRIKPDHLANDLQRCGTTRASAKCGGRTVAPGDRCRLFVLGQSSVLPERIAGLTPHAGDFAADYSKVTIQHAFIQSFLQQCP